MTSEENGSEVEKKGLDLESTTLGRSSGLNELSHVNEDRIVANLQYSPLSRDNNRSVSATNRSNLHGGYKYLPPRLRNQ